MFSNCYDLRYIKRSQFDPKLNSVYVCFVGTIVVIFQFIKKPQHIERIGGNLYKEIFFTKQGAHLTPVGSRSSLQRFGKTQVDVFQFPGFWSNLM